MALVGYTNAGKSTLFNLLTKSDIETADKLFTTLDSTTRVMSVGYPVKVVFSDTVGFIRKLPHQLVESFKSTLEEVSRANLLLHVADCSDPNVREHIDQTMAVLAEIGAEKVPYLMVYNKLDTSPDFAPSDDGAPRSFAISALTGEGIDQLRAELVSRAGMFFAPARQIT